MSKSSINFLIITSSFILSNPFKSKLEQPTDFIKLYKSYRKYYLKRLVALE